MIINPHEYDFKAKTVDIGAEQVRASNGNIPGVLLSMDHKLQKDLRWNMKYKDLIMMKIMLYCAK